MGLKVAILSRGYGRKSSGSEVIIVSDGTRKKVSSRMGGDEPGMLASLLSEAVVIVCNDRARAGKLAVEKYGCEVCILDDGYQHLKVRRDLNILLIRLDYSYNLKYTLRNRLLREPLTAMNRADCVVFTGSKSDKFDNQLIKKFKRYCQSLPLIKVGFKSLCFYEFKSKEKLPLSAIEGKKVLCFAGIANPESFKQTVLSLKPQQAGFKFFSDHYWYSEKDLEELIYLKTKCDADFLITTEKDATRLEDYNLDNFSCLALRVDLEFIEGEKTFLTLIDNVV